MVELLKYYGYSDKDIELYLTEYRVPNGDKLDLILYECDQDLSLELVGDIYT